MEKTHAMRVLEARKVAYATKVYDASGTFHSGTEAAALVGADPRTVYKTLVVIREDKPRAKPLLVMVPVEAEVDLKSLAAALGEKKLRMAKQREAESLTGLQVGGISALGLKQPAKFDVFLDESARELEKVHISAGARGIDLELRVDDLVKVTGAALVPAV